MKLLKGIMQYQSVDSDNNAQAKRGLKQQEQTEAQRIALVLYVIVVNPFI